MNRSIDKTPKKSSETPVRLKTETKTSFVADSELK